LTNENEKKNESEHQFDWLMDYVAKHEHTIEEDDKDVDNLLRKADEMDARLKEERNSDMRMRIQIHSRFLTLQAMVINDRAMTNAFLFSLATKIFQKGDVEVAKKRFDDHIAKRLGQLFGDSGHEEMYT
jgi:hypothetical protein